MSDFDTFNEIDPPDQWDDIVSRSATPQVGSDGLERNALRRWRAIVAVAAVGVAVVAGLVVLQTSRGDDVALSPVSPPDSSVAATTSPVPSTDALAPSPTTATDATTTTLPTRALSCADGDLGEIMALLQSGPIPLDVDSVPNLGALVTFADRTVIGNVTSVVREPGQFSDWTSLDVEVTETLAAPPIDEIVERISFPSSRTLPTGDDPIAQPVAIEGLRFVAVLERLPDAPGGWAVFAQGLSVACDDTGPVSAVQERIPNMPLARAWSIVDLVEAVRAMDRVVPTPTGVVQRPVFEPDVCTMVSARERVIADGPATFFAKPSDHPVPIQVFADPDLGPAGPIVMVMRFRDRNDDVVQGDGVTPLSIGSNDSIRIRIHPNGAGEATWSAGDGTTGYLRSRGISEWEGLGKAIAFATPRDLDATIPGFDFFTDEDRTSQYTIDGQLPLLHEAMNTGLSGSSATSQCQQSSTGLVYYTTRISGDPVLQFGGVLDRPPPAEVGISDDSAIMISGNFGDESPTIADLVEADEAQWIALLAQPDIVDQQSDE